MTTATNYGALFVDANGRSATMHFNTDTDEHAAAIANAFAGKSTATWAALEKKDSLTVDSGTYPNYRASDKPTAGCSIKDQGWLFYGLQSRRHTLRITVPAVLDTLLSPTKKTIGADPCSAVGKLVDQEAVVTTMFVRGKYHWGTRKNW